jgi:hypothetical protein
MRQVTRISPANSIVFIHGGRGHVTPLAIRGAQVLATNSCISIACDPEIDGPTDIVFGDVEEVGLDRPPDFEGILRTPDRTVVVTTVDDQTFLSMGVVAELTILKIWRTHPRPAIVTVAVEAPADINAARQAMFSMECATRTSVPLPQDVFSTIFLSDAAIPQAHRDFNPWLDPEFLRSGARLTIRNPKRLTVATGLLPRLSRPPDMDVVLGTPSKQVWIFDGRGEVLLKADCRQHRTRVCTWSERSGAMQDVTIVLRGA